MTYHRSAGIKELLFLRSKLDCLIDSLADAHIDLPSSHDPSGYWSPPRYEIAEIGALCEQIQALVQGPSFTLVQSFLVSVDLRFSDSDRRDADSSAHGGSTYLLV